MFRNQNVMFLQPLKSATVLPLLLSFISIAMLTVLVNLVTAYLYPPLASVFKTAQSHPGYAVQLSNATVNQYLNSCIFFYWFVVLKGSYNSTFHQILSIISTISNKNTVRFVLKFIPMLPAF